MVGADLELLDDALASRIGHGAVEGKGAHAVDAKYLEPMSVYSGMGKEDRTSLRSSVYTGNSW